MFSMALDEPMQTNVVSLLSITCKISCILRVLFALVLFAWCYLPM